MTILAVAILMLACALSTASAMLQVVNQPTRRIPYVDNSSMRSGSGSKWLFFGAIVLIAIGSFVYSRGNEAASTMEFAVFLIIGVCPVVLIRWIHNRRVGRKMSTPKGG